MSGDNPNYSNFENSQNTKKSPGDPRRLVLFSTSKRFKRLARLVFDICPGQ